MSCAVLAPATVIETPADLAVHESIISSSIPMEKPAERRLYAEEQSAFLNTEFGSLPFSTAGGLTVFEEMGGQVALLPKDYSHRQLLQVDEPPSLPWQSLSLSLSLPHPSTGTYPPAL